MRSTLVSLAGLLTIAFAVAAQTATAPGFPPKMEITHRSEPSPGAAIVAVAEKVAWPLTVFLLTLAFYKPLKVALEQIGRQGGEIGVAGLVFKLPAMQNAPLGEDVLSFKAGNPFVVLNDSAKSTLLHLLHEPGFRDYVVIDLGNGGEWITSRLFIFAIMLQRIKRIRCIVFREGSARRFLGTARPDHVRWALAKDQPWLEQTYATVLADVMPRANVLNNKGALPPQVAEEVVRRFVHELAMYRAGFVDPPLGKEWATFEAQGSTNIEKATWLCGDDIRRILAEDLRVDAIVAAGDRKTEARSLLRCSAPWVARVTEERALDSIIDRVAFLNDLGNKILPRLEVEQR